MNRDKTTIIAGKVFLARAKLILNWRTVIANEKVLKRRKKQEYYQVFQKAEQFMLYCSVFEFNKKIFACNTKQD
jgi:hypothetical protein